MSQTSGLTDDMLFEEAGNWTEVVGKSADWKGEGGLASRGGHKERALITHVSSLRLP